MYLSLALLAASIGGSITDLFLDWQIEWRTRYSPNGEGELVSDGGQEQPLTFTTTVPELNPP